MTFSWYTATVKPFAEELVANGLTEQGFEIYLPLKFSKETFGRKVMARPTLRFEGYVFIAADMSHGHARPINNTRGIDGLLPPGDQAPRALPDFWVPEMRAFELLEFFRAKSRKKQEPRKDLRPGDPVMIDRPAKPGDKEDPMHGSRGELMKIENYIASVLIGMVIVKLPAIDLRKIEEGETQAA